MRPVCQWPLLMCKFTSPLNMTLLMLSLGTRANSDRWKHVRVLTRTRLPTLIITAWQTRRKANIGRREVANNNVCKELITDMTTAENKVGESCSFQRHDVKKQVYLVYLKLIQRQNTNTFIVVLMPPCYSCHCFHISEPGSAALVCRLCHSSFWTRRQRDRWFENQCCRRVSGTRLLTGADWFVVWNIMSILEPGLCMLLFLT